jgi:HAD superfamily hydrolase (TIGR01509 family)
VRALIFDFDGVIANSEPLHYRGYRDVLAGEGVALAEADYYSRYLGYDDVGAFMAIAADRGLEWSDAQIDRLVEQKAAHMEQLEQDAGVLFPGAREAVVRAAAAMPIAIASGALGAEIRRILAHAQLASYFSAIVAAEDTPASKPAPDPYAKAVSLLAAAHGPIAPGECVALEDSRWGLESARAAGLRTVAVAHTYSPEELRTSADLVIPSMQAFDLEALQRRFPD